MLVQAFVNSCDENYWHVGVADTCVSIWGWILMPSFYVSCMSCRRDFNVKKMKFGLCPRCRTDHYQDHDADVYDEIMTPADRHDFEYNGPESDIVDDD